MAEEYKKLITNNKEHNKRINQKVEQYLKENPIVGAHKSIHFSDIEIKSPDDSWQNVQEKIQNKKSLHSKVYATATIVNKHNGRIEDKKRVYLGSIPYKNKLGTYLIEGSHYTVPNQFRLKPSGYTMIKNNGNIETMFNTNGGHSMKIVSPQSKDDLWVQVGSRKFNAYDIFKLLGASDEEIKNKIGEKLFNMLKSKSDFNKTIKSLAEVTKAVAVDKANTPQGIEYIRKSLESGKLNKEATKDLLGVESDKINKDVLMSATNNVVKVKKGERAPDDKENLIYKKVVPAEDLILEGIHKNLQSELWKKKAPLNSFNPTKVEQVINEPLLNKASKRFLTSSALSRMPEGYNPLQLQQINAEVTPLGEGGVKSTESITPEMRSLHLSQVGFIDPIKSPEGATTGITLSLTENAYVDKDNNPAIMVKNLKTGKLEIKPLKELWHKKIAFPDVSPNGTVGIRENGTIKEGHIKDADYQIPHLSHLYGPGMNSLGAIASNDQTRNLMASKHILQALPLVEREKPAVALADETGKPMLERYAKQHLPIAPTNGVITNIDKTKGVIEIKGIDGKKHKVSFSSYKTPLNAKTYIKHYPIVKVGDKVKAGQHLAESNYTKDGQYALGTTLRTAFMLYPGTRNDAFVVSESAAKKMTSLHSTKFDVKKDKNIEFNKRKFITMFPDIAKKINLNNYDEKGFLKPGIAIKKGEPIYLGIKKMDNDEIKFANDKVKKLLYGGYAPFMEEWKYSDPAKIDKLTDEKGNVRVVMTYKSPLKVGDKIAGRSGNKGIISKIIPDEEMPKTEDGKLIDLMMGGAGIASRQNPAQVIEATLGSVAKKTGKQYVIPHHFHEDLADFAYNEAKKHNVKLYHKVYDPVRKIHIKQPVFVGDYHVQKLFKQGDTAWSAVGYGATDGLDQPKKGGKTSASSISNMEVNALLVHGAKDFLRETFKIRSQKNREWFNSFMRGDTFLPVPEDKTSLKKFKALLHQMNMDVKQEGNKIKVVPLTDKDVVRMSNGEVTKPHGLKQGTLTDIKGGFYDTKIFGGNGTNYGHIDLGEKIINPNYQDVVARALGMTPKKLTETIQKEGISKIEKAIHKIDLDKIKNEAKKEIKKTNDPNKINQGVKLIKAVNKLQDNNLHLRDVALISKVPVIPTFYRPVSKLPNGTVVDHDINNHYAAIIDASNTLKEAKKELGNNHPVVGELRTEVQKHIGALYGVNESPDPKLRKREIKSVQEMIAGKKPKESLWQTNILQNKVFTSGRAVIIPKDKYLAMDEVELPKEVAWKMYTPHLHREMARAGMSSTDIQQHIDNKTDTAKRFLDDVMKRVPVVINRAPTLHKHNMIGAYPKISADNAMKISPLHENPLNADYDGDQLAIHVPLTEKAIDDVKNKLLASKQIFGAKNKDHIAFDIDLDPYIGFYHATKYNKHNLPTLSKKRK